MGFSQTAVFVIVFATSLLLAGVMLRGTLHAQQEITDGWREAQQRTERQREAAMAITDVRKTGPTLIIEATNTGSTTLDLGGADLLIDGAWATPQITSIQVEGAASNVWPPGSDAEVNLEPGVGPPPDNVALIADTGTAAYWRS